MCEEKNENEDEAENEGPRKNRRGDGGANVECENEEERQGEATKTSERCRGCLALFDAFASDDSSPFAVPSPLSQRACQRDPREHDPVTAEQRWLQLLDAVTTTTRNASVFGAKNGDFLTFLVLPSGITFELKLERNSFFHHLHSMHLKNDSKPRLPCNNTQFSSKIVLEKNVKRKYADFILIFGCQKKEPCT